MTLINKDEIYIISFFILWLIAFLQRLVFRSQMRNAAGKSYFVHSHEQKTISPTKRGSLSGWPCAHTSLQTALWIVKEVSEYAKWTGPYNNNKPSANYAWIHIIQPADIFNTKNDNPSFALVLGFVPTSTRPYTKLSCHVVIL